MSTQVEAVHEHEHPAEHTYQPYRTGLAPAVIGMLLFLGSELALFGAFFMYYGIKRSIESYGWPPINPVSLKPYEIPITLTGINTTILILSSFTCEFALMSLMRGKRSWLTRWLIITFLLGATFVSLQMYEYFNELGFTPQDGAGASIFYGLTGLHGFHVMVGLTLLLFGIIRAARGHFKPESHPGLLIISIYWHFVDIVWIILFTLVYLLPDTIK